MGLLDFATRSSELPQSLQIPAQPESQVSDPRIPSVNDPQPGTVTRIDTSPSGGTSRNEPASAVGENILPAVGGIMTVVLALLAVVALGQLFDVQVG